nr:NBS-containing resistance-like protein [Tanacetum cinerariifolium]
MVTPSQSGIVKPLERFSLHTASISLILKTSFVALQNSHWRQAMLDEYNALIKNGTWILVPKPAGVNMVRSMWLFKHKFHANRTLNRYKARLVANGSSQQQGDNLLSWSSKRQHTISRSSAEAEYRGVANVVAVTAWHRNLLPELHSPLSTATLVYCDNVSFVYLSANPVQHQRTKHIEIDIHFVRDMVQTDHIRVLHVPSRYQYADIFNKDLPTALFEDFRFSLSVWLPPAQTAGAY